MAKLDFTKLEFLEDKSRNTLVVFLLYLLHMHWECSTKDNNDLNCSFYCVVSAQLQQRNKKKSTHSAYNIHLIVAVSIHQKINYTSLFDVHVDACAGVCVCY